MRKSDVCHLFGVDESQVYPTVAEYELGSIEVSRKALNQYIEEWLDAN